MCDSLAEGMVPICTAVVRRERCCFVGFNFLKSFETINDCFDYRVPAQHNRDRLCLSDTFGPMLARCLTVCYIGRLTHAHNLTMCVAAARRHGQQSEEEISQTHEARPLRDTAWCSVGGAID